VRTFTITGTATSTVVTPSEASVPAGQSATFTATVSSSNGTPSDGYVEFLVDDSAYGNPVPLNDGTAAVSVTEPAGTYTIAARYTGDAVYAATVPSAETTATFIVTQSTATKTPTSTAVTPTQVFVAPGQSATFTATVSSSNGTPSDGSVQFLVDGVAYGNPVAVSGGTAQIAITEPLGTYTIAAQYGGDATFAATLASAEAVATLTVSQPTTSKIATSTVLTPATAMISFGQSATFTATVSSLAGTPTDGSIQFLINGSNYLSPVLVSNGQAQLAITVPAGTYTIAAQYTGDAVYAATTSADETSATLTVNPVATSTTVTPTTATVALGQSATFTATVSSANDSPADGSVQFLVDGSDFGTPVPVGTYGTAQLAIAAPRGSHTITAQYLGDANYAATLAAAETGAALTVTAATTTTTLAPNSILVGPGQLATFTATVTSSDGTPPDGSVQFLVDGSDFGTPVTLSSGTAQASIGEPVGTYSITAQYLGDGANFGPSPVSSAATLNVASSAVNTTMALQSSENPSKFGDSVSFDATVSPASGSATPTGTVQFSVDGSAFGNPVTLTNGVATITTSTLAVGTHSVSASYTSNNVLFNPVSGQLTGGQEVDKADVTVGLTVDHPTTTVGDTVNFTVTVAAVTAGLPTPGGSVTISMGSTVLGTANLSDGQATIPTSALPVGSDSIIASYGGDPNFAPNSSSTFTETVDPVLAATSIAAVAPNPRNTPVSSVDVTFNEPVDLATFTTAALTLTDDGGSNLITNAVSLALVMGTTSTYSINGLAGLTAAEGEYTLTLDAADLDDTNQTPGTGTISTTWLMDTIPPTSTVNSLPAQTTSTSFTVSVTSNDPAGANNSPPSGVASIAIYDSEDNGPFTLLATVTPASPSTTFTGQAGNTYGFYSVATDNAGNVQPTPTAAQATVQIVSGLTITSIAPISPNPRDTTVATADVTFSESIDLSSFDASDVTLTQNGVDVPLSSLTFTPVSGTTYQIGGLATFDATDGLYVLTVNAGGINASNEIPGTGTLSTSWLMDTTPPTSHVINSLGTSQSTDSFPVSVTFSDPAGSGGAPASGVSSVDLYVSVNNGPFSLY
jgi:hypothetical protein